MLQIEAPALLIGRCLYPGPYAPAVPRTASWSPLATPCCCLPCSLRCPDFARPECCTAMASLRILAFDHEGRLIQFDTWLDDLQLYLLNNSKDSVSLFDHTSGAAPAPPATADSATRSLWLTRDGAARLAIRNHLPLAKCAHFGQHRTAQALYDAVVARYSSPATTALGRLKLPYLFRELFAFATVEDLVSHLCTRVARYRAALPAEFLDKNPPPMYINLCRSWHLARPSLRGVPPTPLAPSYASAAALDVLGAEDVRAGSASGKRCSRKGKGGRGGGGGSGGGGGGSGGGSGGLAAAVEAAMGVAVEAAVGVVAVGLELLSVEVLAVARGRSSSVGARPHCPSSFVSGFLGVGRLGHRYFSRLDDAWRAEFGDEAERPRWADLLRSGIAIFDLHYDAILAAMYALSVSAEGDCYLCVPPDPGIEAAALGASESALPGIAPAEALHTFTLD
ncbi:unnamed protein product [Closterium sp. NIES-54]